MFTYEQAYGAEAGVAGLKWLPYGGIFREIVVRIRWYMKIILFYICRTLSHRRTNAEEFGFTPRGK